MPGMDAASERYQKEHTSGGEQVQEDNTRGAPLLLQYCVATNLSLGRHCCIHTYLAGAEVVHVMSSKTGLLRCVHAS